MRLPKSLDEVDRRVFWWIMVIIIAIPWIKPIGLPIEVSELTVNSVNTFDSLKAGDIAIWAAFDPAGIEETGPTQVLAIDYLMERGVKLIFGAWYAGPDYAPMCDWVINQNKLFERYEYGVDFVNLGYVPGGEAASAGLANEFQKMIKLDAYGNEISDFQLAKEMTGPDSIKLGIGKVTLFEIRHWATPFGIPLIPIIGGSAIMEYMTYYDSGVIPGFLGGKNGGAELEFLLGRPGINIRAMDSVTVGLILVLVLILFGNVLDFFNRSRGGI